MVTIDHGFGIKSRYCGIEPGDIEKGQKVEVSEVIGTLGDIPCELLDGPHLHLEITVNGAYTRPGGGHWPGSEGSVGHRGQDDWRRRIHHRRHESRHHDGEKVRL